MPVGADLVAATMPEIVPVAHPGAGKPRLESRPTVLTLGLGVHVGPEFNGQPPSGIALEQGAAMDL